jgi:hypothetical protein
MPAETPSPSRIFEIGCGYRAAKTLLSAIELGVFTVLAEQPLDAAALAHRLGLHGRAAADFFDALTALGFLERSLDGRYANAPEADRYLDRGKPTYIGALFEQYNGSEYGLWGSLTQALRSGTPQTNIAATRHFSGLYADPERLRAFVKSMTAGSLLAAEAIARQFRWQNYRTVMDVGTAEGCLPVAVARAHPHLRGGGFDLPPVEALFEAYVAEHGLANRLRFFAGDFFETGLPPADVLVLGRVLHNWDLETKRMLLRKTYDALPNGGALLVYEPFIPEDRRSNAASLLSSLNMLLWTAGGFDFTATDCMAWMREAGFRDLRIQPLVGDQAMVVGEKAL